MDNFLKALPEAQEKPVYYYWHVQRKVVRRGKVVKGEWKFVRDVMATKSQITNMWNQYYRTGEFRLRCVLKYSGKK